MDRGAWRATGVAKSQTPMIKYICTQILPALFSFIFNWRIIAWQCCVGFCHTAAWISHRYPYVPSPWAFLPPPTPSHLFRLSLSTRLSSLHHTANSHWLFILHMVMYMFPCHSRLVPSSSSHTVSKCMSTEQSLHAVSLALSSSKSPPPKTLHWYLECHWLLSVHLICW